MFAITLADCSHRRSTSPSYGNSRPLRVSFSFSVPLWVFPQLTSQTVLAVSPLENFRWSKEKWPCWFTKSRDNHRTLAQFTSLLATTILHSPLSHSSWEASTTKHSWPCGLRSCCSLCQEHSSTQQSTDTHLQLIEVSAQTSLYYLPVCTYSVSLITKCDLIWAGIVGLVHCCIPVPRTRPCSEQRVNKQSLNECPGNSISSSPLLHSPRCSLNEFSFTSELPTAGYFDTYFRYNFLS